MMKKVISTVVCIIMLTTTVVYADPYVKEITPAENIQIMVDGVEMIPKDVNGKIVSPFLSDGTTYLPIRAVSIALGMKVLWDPYSKTVCIGDIPATGYSESDAIRLVVSGREITPKDANGNVVNPILIDGTTYVPVRAVTEALGKEISWDGVTRTVYIGEQIIKRDFFEINPRTFAKFSDRVLMTVNSQPVVGNYFNGYIALLATDDVLKQYSENYSPSGTLQTLTIDSASAAAFFTSLTRDEIITIFALNTAAEKAGFTNDPQFISMVDEAIINLFPPDGIEENIIKKHSISLEPSKDFMYKLATAQCYSEKLIEKCLNENYDKEIALIKGKILSSYVTAKHILVEDEKLANEIITKIKNGENFDELMKKHNIDPGATPEGYTFTYAEMVEPFEKAAFALKENEYTTTPVQTSYGYHIIMRLPLNTLLFDSAEDSWITDLATKAAQKEISSLINNAVVEYTPEYEKYINTIR